MNRPSFLPKVDPFLLWLIGMVTAASLLPVRGAAAGFVEMLADVAIALLFFLHGAKLSRAAIVQGAGNWRLHLMVLAFTYVLFPSLGLAITRLAGSLIDPLLLSGILFLTLLPSTVQSSIAFTAMARGNVAAAVCSASLSNFIGIALTPLLVGVLMNLGDGSGPNWQAARSIVVQLLLPFLAGHLLRPLIGGFIDRNKGLLMPVDRGSILLVVYSAFSAAVVGGIWEMLDITDLLTLLAVSAVILAIVIGINEVVAKLAKLPREDAIVLLFCGSKKSLVSGVPMAGALFAPAQVGLVVLPLMIFHQLQLFVCAWLAGRYQQQAIAAELAAAPPPPDPAAVPQSAEAIAAAAAARGITIPDECAPGVAANLALLETHATRLGDGR